jgi:hypothetical protein
VRKKWEEIAILQKKYNRRDNEDGENPFFLNVSFFHFAPLRLLKSHSMHMKIARS